jgi:DNA (cytosine-5)-methyltransferase 1
METDKDIQLIYVDLFCGAGGTSTGVESARINGKQFAKVIACVNHDANAIASHAANHPEALHFTEDIRTLDLTELIKHVALMRIKYPNAKLSLWASLECTNHSKAKGGVSRDADSRTLADHLFRYIEALNPDLVQIENVVEFKDWGPLKIKVVADKNGNELYCPVEYKKSNKKRVIACNPVWVPIVELKGSFYNIWVNKLKGYGYNYDSQVLNSANYGAYTARVRYFGQFAKPKIQIAWPIQTHFKLELNPRTKTKQLSLFEETTAKKYWKPVKEVLDFSDEGESIFNRKKPLVEKTLERVYLGLVKHVAGGKEAFLSSYYGNGDNCSSINKPSPTVTTKDRIAIVNPCFLYMQYGNGTATNINDPAATVTTNPKHQLVTCNRWVMNTNFNNVGSSIEEPAQTITANRKWHYLMNPQYLNTGGSIDKPCFTLIARMDKMPPYLIEVEGGRIAIEIYESDSYYTRKIKEFMALYGIVDIKMRMLRIDELKLIMGFPKDYTLIGTQADQKKFIGNAVEVKMSQALCKATALGILKGIKPAEIAA